ncbi:Ni/Fe hydrogenase subunit alpha [candidate division KSB1 bacterium]
MSSRTIKVEYLARVEGEGQLYIRIKDNKVKNARLKIYEPPRFFQAFLRGRSHSEAPDITARICGICPVSHQVTTAQALENAFGISVTGQLRALRRLLVCGEWIESHVLHIFMLHAPDFLGYESAIHMAKDHPEVVEAALKLKKLGNNIVKILGGREIHPVNVRVGGFYKLPDKNELRDLGEELNSGLDTMTDMVKLLSSFDYPDFEQDYLFVSLRHPDEYPFNEGQVVSSTGLDIAAGEYEQHFSEVQVAHSTSMHSYINGQGPYLTGPLARLNLNRGMLSGRAAAAAQMCGLNSVCNNPFRSILVRAVETVYAFEEAVRIIKEYEVPERPAYKVEPCRGTGFSCTEAPRGVLFNRISTDENGIILQANIVTPTAQNQAIIESDLLNFAGKYITLPDEELKWKCEQAIRNYDPCISCSTHFLALEVERERNEPKE